MEQELNRLIAIEKEYKLLKIEYSENAVICSMNDMKDMYEIQQNEIKTLKNTIYDMREQNKAIKLFINTIIKNVRSYKDSFILESRLEFLKEFIQSSLR